MLNQEADVEYLRSLTPDVVIIATGAELSPLELPGAELALSVVDVLLGRVAAGERVLIVGAGFVGCETGWHLAHEGKDVRLVDLLPEDELMADEHPVNRATLFYQLQQAGVQFTCGVTPKELRAEGLIVKDAGGATTLLEAESIINAAGFHSRRGLYQRLREEEPGWEVYQVGDCMQVGSFYHAVQSAFQVARHI